MFLYNYKDYQEPPPPPPEPPPDEPPPELPPEELPELLDGLDGMALVADFIVESINFLNEVVLNDEYPSYQVGACNDIISNFLIIT